MKLIPESRHWYKMTSVQAALVLAILETVQAFGYPMPEGLTVVIALLIPVLRIIKQESIK